MNIRSIQRLGKCHPDLRKVLIEAAKTCPIDFEITETIRTLARQKQLMIAGATRTMNSRHLADKDGLSRASDIVCYVDGKVRWDWPLYAKAATHIKAVAAKLGIPIVWGGDWKTFKDGPHFELDRKIYP